MVYPLEPDAVPSDIEQLAFKKGLGQLQDVYSATLSSIGMMIILLLSSAALVYATFNLLHDDTQGWLMKLCLLTLIIVALLVSGYGARSAYYDRTDKTFLYENGLILKCSSSLQALHWNEVQYTEARAFYTQNYSGFSCKLHLKNGESIEVSGELFYRIQQRIGR